MNNMTKKILSLLVLLMTVASSAWAQRLYLDVNGTAATLKYSANEADYEGKPSFTGASWAKVGSIKTTVETITVDASCANFAGTSLKSMFNSFKTLKTVTGLGNINATNVTTTMNMFRDCWALTSVDLSGLNTSSVTTMECMFEGCNALTTVRGLNTAGVSILSKMFWNCWALTTLDLSGFNTASATAMNAMFYYCYSLTKLDLSGFNTSNVTTMQNMFYGCSSLTTLNLSSFNTANVTSMANMFYGCSSLTTLDLRSFNTASVTNMFAMFQNCKTLKEIIVGDGWSTEAVTSSSIMFKDCTSLPCYNASRVDKTKANTGYSGFLTLAGTFKVYTDAEASATTFTEAEFNMPDYDATVEFDIVRDMNDATYPVEFAGLAERVVVKKKTGSEEYEPVTPLTIQLIDQLAATDAQNIIAAAGIKVKVLKGTLNGSTIEYDETNTLELEAFTADMQPGLYKIVAEPTDATTSPYIGTVSLAFEALAGFPVEIAAKEYVTYYSATDNLALEENSGAKLYTITGVGETKATATEIPSANKLTPFLVYNPTEETKTFLLIPTDDEINQTYADEFKGTAVAATIAASTDAQTNYAFNGKQFVWVRTALPVAANKAWLEVPTSTARSIALVFADDDATAISAVSGSPADNGAVYDLSGRKVTNPAKKGVYIVNGKKVVK